MLLREAAGSPGVDLRWLLEVVVVSVCAAVHHGSGAAAQKAAADSARGPAGYDAHPVLEDAQAPGVPVASRRPLGGPAAEAWDWLMRLGSAVAAQAEAQGPESPLLAPLALQALLCARLLPGPWVGAGAETLQLHAALQRLLPDGREAESEGLLHLSLPEDALAVGLVRLPPAPLCPAGRAPGSARARREGRKREDEAEDGSSDEVVMCSPVMQQLSLAAGKPRASALPDVDAQASSEQTPEPLQGRVRLARLRRLLGHADALRGARAGGREQSDDRWDSAEPPRDAVANGRGAKAAANGLRAEAAPFAPAPRPVSPEAWLADLQGAGEFAAPAPPGLRPADAAMGLHGGSHGDPQYNVIYYDIIIL